MEKIEELEAVGMGTCRCLTPKVSSPPYELFEARLVAADRGPGVRIHENMDETFYIMEGSLRFHVDGEEFLAGAGERIFVPRGTAHGWQTVTDGLTQFLFMFNPAGDQWSYLSALIDLINSNPADRDQRMSELFERYDNKRVGGPEYL